MASDGPTSAPNGVLLLVEDEPFLLTYMHKVLSREGYDVLTACSAEDAWELFQQEASRVRAVVTDVFMQGDWDGVELARRVNEAAPSTRVLLVTGYPSTRLLGPGRSVLEKPFTADLLKAAVGRLVGAAGSTGGTA
ncbi:MAG: response regulator [Verrucomicrobia bacterium]|nr:response regulator [Verrucomicrobiota bacterium]